MSLVIKFYFTSSMLNMFRTLIHPSLWACDFSIVAQHWPFVLVSVCVGVLVWLVWCGIRVAGCVSACYMDILEPGRARLTILRMRIACSISKATDSHSEHAIVIALLPQQWLHERAAVWYVHRLSCRSCPEGPAAPRKEIFRPKSEPANLWDACPNGTWKDSLSHGIRFCPNSVSIPLPDRSLYVVKYMRTCSHNWLYTDCIWVTVAIK